MDGDTSNAWLAVGVMALVVLVPVVSICIIDAIWLRPRRRRRFLEGREAMPDEVFATNAGVVDEDLTALIAVRRAFAAQCGLPPETIYVDDNWHELNELTFDGFDTVEFWIAVEHELKQTISETDVPTIPWPKRKQLFGEWACAMAQWIKQHCVQSNARG